VGRLDDAHVVALGVLLHALERVARVLDEQLVELVARAQDLLGVDVDVRRVAGEAEDRPFKTASLVLFVSDNKHSVN
jgi:hypothetical protein